MRKRSEEGVRGVRGVRHEEQYKEVEGKKEEGADEKEEEVKFSNM